jgi:AraC family transcriptional regulator
MDHTGVVENRVISGVSLSVNRFPAKLELPRHHHADGCLILFLEGESTETFGGASFHSTPGDVVLLPAEETHSDRIAERGATVFIIKPPRAWVEDIREHGAFLDAPERLARDRVSALAAQLYAESRRPDAASPLCIQALLFEIGACLIRRGAATSVGEPKWLSRVRSRIDDTYREKLCLSDLAGEAGVHSVHLARTFRECYGVTVGQYLRGRRIEAAARALRRSDTSLVNIALDAGFTSQAHFCTAFRRMMGCTPSQYRRAVC